MSQFLGAMYFFWQPRLEILIVPIAYGVAQAVNVWHAAVVVRHDIGPPFAGVSRGGLRFAVVLLVTLGAMLVVLIPLSRGLTGSPVSLVAAGIASAWLGCSLPGSLWVAPSEVRGFLEATTATGHVTSESSRRLRSSHKARICGCMSVLGRLAQASSDEPDEIRRIREAEEATHPPHGHFGRSHQPIVGNDVNVPRSWRPSSNKSRLRISQKSAAPSAGVSSRGRSC